jgi:hypothetical protein
MFGDVVLVLRPTGVTEYLRGREMEERTETVIP